MVDILKKFAAALRTVKLLSLLLTALRVEQHGLYTSNLFPTSMHATLECWVRGIYVI